ncbi:MAG: hypothetical protein HQK76_16610 [Desulfobacterales bacterium]|nr:hypothetical protein [Desulfobacterales bacterium]
MNVSPANSGSVNVSGSITYSNSPYYTIVSNTDAKLEAFPAKGYKFVGWSGDLSGSLNPAYVSFTCDKIITANFTITEVEPDGKYTITVNQSENGAVYPSGETKLDKGEEQKFSITPNTGYIIQEVIIDGVSKGVISEYTFLDIKENHSITVLFTQTHPPVANAGNDQTVDEKEIVRLNGSNSIDDGNDIVTYHWTQTGGTDVILSNSDSASPIFTAPDTDGVDILLEFKLTVTDSYGFSSDDYVDIIVKDIPTQTIELEKIPFTHDEKNVLFFSFENVSEILALSPYNVADSLTDTSNQILKMNYGLIDIKIKVPNPGAKAKITRSNF